MKTQFNITSMKWDLERYASREDFATALQGFDGVELMDYGDDISTIIPEEKVIGVHMLCPYHWLDFWNGDLERCIREYSTLERVYQTFGGRPLAVTGKSVVSGADFYPAGDDQTAAGRNPLSENGIYAGYRPSDAYGSGTELPGGGGGIYPPVSGSAWRAV